MRDISAIPTDELCRIPSAKVPSREVMERFMRLKPVLVKIGIPLLTLVCLVEVAVRLSGLTDFPAYAVDDGIGYIARPDQSGRFLDKNAWAFNGKSMPTADPWAPVGRFNVMLIGNSIVMGGNPLDQKDKLAPQISKDMGPHYAIWPLAIGGWTNVNEMVYLQRNPDVAKATNFFIWEYMPGGLSGLSAWRGDYVFPRQRPLWASWYVFRKYVLPKFLPINTSELPPKGTLVRNHQADFDAWVAELSKTSGLEHPGVVFLYPEKKDLLDSRHAVEWLPERKILEDICAKYRLKLVDVAKDPAWNESLYRDGTHPTPQGNVVLARILANAALETLAANGR